MLKRKKQREHGKIKLSKYFQDFKKGDKVAVVRELSAQPKFPKQLQGRTGVIESKRGSNYIVKIKDLNKEKTYIIHPVHLNKIKNIKSEKKTK
jgi:large subunit ribosomal protein L21e